MFLNHPKIFNEPVLIKDSQLSALKFMDDFFGNYPLSVARHNLWKMQEVCMTSENEHYSRPLERSNLLQQVKDLEKLLEAARIINKYIILD